jgi:Ca2+-binding EF-hand superfamily protein
MKENFSRHDLDGDGYIAEAELDTLPKHKKGQRPQQKEQRQEK